MFDQITYIFFSIDSSEYWYSCFILTSLSSCMISMCCQLCSISYTHVSQNHIQFQADCCHLAAGCTCITVYFHTHSPITLFWLFTVPIVPQVPYNSTVSAHLYDKSECVSLHTGVASQDTPDPSLHYSTKEIE